MQQSWGEYLTINNDKKSMHVNNQPCPKGSQTTTTVYLHTLVLHCRSIKKNFIIIQYLFYHISLGAITVNNSFVVEKKVQEYQQHHVFISFFYLVALQLFGGVFFLQISPPPPPLPPRSPVLTPARGTRTDPPSCSDTAQRGHPLPTQCCRTLI